MKSSRKAFLAVAAVSVGVALVPGHPEAASVPASPSPTPSPQPTPSPGARALADGMRRFDPHLSDAQLTQIANGIEQGFGFGATLNPHGRFLQNSDAPLPDFAVKK
ncbi:MAG TPA: hypothetical protein VMV73_04830 [Candidatus Dormibacteraeota bacterium]|nr:hypothetical protein [Candidatus Dormibacteraeota bacterium]